MLVPVLVVTILVVDAVVTVFVLCMVFGVRRAAQELESRAAVAGEQVLLRPRSANYQGTSGPGDRVRGSGVLFLTRDRLVFRKATGAVMEFPIADVLGTRLSNSFGRRWSWSPGTSNLVLQLRSGNEVAFRVKDASAVQALVEEARAEREAKSGW